MQCEGNLSHFLVKWHFPQVGVECMMAHLQPGVHQRFAHAEPPPDRHLQQVVDETDAWTQTDALVEKLLKCFRSSAATRWPREELPFEALPIKTARSGIKPAMHVQILIE